MAKALQLFFSGGNVHAKCLVVLRLGNAGGCTLASTAIMAPARVLVNRGVMTIAPKVDAVVMSTDSATSPCAMYVATFEDCRVKRSCNDGFAKG